jgi:hypothetical protein
MGDRLCLTFAMAGLARLANAHIYVRWCENGHLDCVTRQYDLNAMSATFTFPPFVTLVPDSQFTELTAGIDV